MAYSEAEFIDLFGGVYEHSAWIAQASWLAAQDLQDPAEIAAIMATVVDNATPEQKLTLIRAHPDLAGRLAVAGGLTEDSTSEQASAGLDQCSEDEFHQFQSLNAAYVDKFSFPFIMAVRNSNRQEILASFSRRLNNTYEQEFATAIEQIHKIARLRLEQLL